MTDAEGNNVYSVLSGPVDLQVLKAVLEPEFPGAEIRIRTSGYDGARTIYVRSESADFEGYAGTNVSEVEKAKPDYLFNGFLAGDIEQVVLQAKQVFGRVSEAGIRVQFEVYDRSGNAAFEQRPAAE